MDRKETAWKKSRKFGDIYGGRKRIKFADNIGRRFHSLKKPGASEELPILIEDNPSRDFFFPISAQEANEALKALPKSDYEGITHIWCRRIKRGDFDKGTNPWAEFIFGSGVRVIILYPWPKSLTLNLGMKKPSNRLRNELEKYGANIEKSGKTWVSTMTHSQLRKFYIQNLLYHEVGHHVDCLPIRLTPMTATCRVPPLSRVKLGIGWSRGVARDAEQ